MFSRTFPRLCACVEVASVLAAMHMKSRRRCRRCAAQSRVLSPLVAWPPWRLRVCARLIHSTCFTRLLPRCVALAARRRPRTTVGATNAPPAPAAAAVPQPPTGVRAAASRPTARPHRVTVADAGARSPRVRRAKGRTTARLHGGGGSRGTKAGARKGRYMTVRPSTPDRFVARGTVGDTQPLVAVVSGPDGHLMVQHRGDDKPRTQPGRLPSQRAFKVRPQRCRRRAKQHRSRL